MLVIPPGERNRSITDKAGSQSPLRISRIVVPVDFSECSLNGLAYAKALAKKFGSRLVILNSVALQYWITSDEYSRYDFPVLMRRAEELARFFSGYPAHSAILPAKRQTLCFSATMEQSVAALVNEYTIQPVRIAQYPFLSLQPAFN